MSFVRILPFFILLMLSLSGCNGDKCIDADDFGFPRFTVSARYNKDAVPTELFGTEDNQVGAWRDSGYVVNGRPLTIVVKNWRRDRDDNAPGDLSAWCPWYGDDDQAHTLGNFSVRFPACAWSSGSSCTTTTSAQINNAPCIMKKGMGLYALIAKPSKDPNANQETIGTPPTENFVVFHLGDKHANYNLYNNILQPGQISEAINGSVVSTSTQSTDTTTPTTNSNTSSSASGAVGGTIGEGRGNLGNDTDPAMQVISSANTPSSTETPEPAGGIVYKYEGVNVDEFKNGKLYFKILDSFYEDNAGQYIVIIKSGVQTENPDPVTFVTNLINKSLFGSSDDQGKIGTIRGIYEGIITNPGYRLTVSAVLSMYVIFFGINFLIGTIQITHTDLIIRIVKIAIVSALLNPDVGWRFFNDNLFVFFTSGVDYIIDQIRVASAVGPAAGGALSLLVAPQLISKLLALLFTSWHGFLYILLYVVALIFFVFATIQSLMIYASSMIMMGMIIVMAPIFICFMLFDITKSLFENWLKQLIFYSMNMIIITAIMAFMGVQVQHTIYANLGFKVCRQDFPDMGPLFQMVKIDDSFPRSIFSWWFPSPKTQAEFSKTQIMIPVPEDHTLSDGTFCPAYGCNAKRYYDLPFLDPKNPQDMYRIKNFFDGEFTQFYGLFYLVILVYLLNKFNASAVQIAGSLANTSGSHASVTHAASEADATVHHKIAELRQSVSSKIQEKTGIRALKTKMGLDQISIENLYRGAVRGVANAVSSNEKTEKGESTRGSVSQFLHEKRHGSEASLSNKDAYQSVVDRVKRNHGIDRSKLNKNASTDYNTRLEETLQKTLGKTKAESETLMQKHGSTQEVLSHAKHSKSFDKLSKAEQQGVTTLMKKPGANGKSLKGLEVEVRQLREFQEKYKQEYNSMSNDEIGTHKVADLADPKKARAYKEKQHAITRKQQAYQQKLRDEYKKASRSKFTNGDWMTDVAGAGYGALFTAVTGKSLRDVPNAQDPNRMTTNERSTQRNIQEARKDLSSEVDKQRTMHQTDILHPQHIARLRLKLDPLAQHHQDLAARDIAFRVDAAMKGGEDPVTMGEKYTREEMTGGRLQQSLGKAKKIEKELMASDPYISGEYQYKDKTDKLSLEAKKVIKERKKMIKAEVQKHTDWLKKTHKP
ncbi:MAG: type IV secretion system protein [Pseudomonadota bacterium]